MGLRHKVVLLVRKHFPPMLSRTHSVFDVVAVGDDDEDDEDEDEEVEDEDGSIGDIFPF